MAPSSASLQDDFARLPMTPPEPADAVLTVPKDAASVTTAIHVISTERAALAHLERLYQTDQLAQDHLARAVDQIARTIRNGNKLVCCGVGKSGKIAQKLEATFNSLGIYSTFLHPTEALHGDLGMIRPHDTLLLISFSGRTPELLLLLPHIPSTVAVIAITSHLHPSTCPLLSFHSSDIGILLPAPIHEDEETSIGVCAPTSSTTVALSLGDALAIATARRLHTSPGRGPAEVFKSYHPGGAIGAASTASTPMSMSTVSFTSSPSDFLPVRQPLPPYASSGMQEAGGLLRGPLITDLITPLNQIPTVISSGNVRLLDVLLTAIQHPSAKSWVFVSPSEIIPPRQLRFLSQGSYIDMDVSSLADLGAPYFVSRKDWLLIPDSCTVEDARRLVPNDSSVSVIGVTSGRNGSECIGVLEAEDLWNSCDD
ncbi:SIS domain-containing protein [Aspergillus heterothallicus]